MNQKKGRGQLFSSRFLFITLSVFFLYTLSSDLNAQNLHCKIYKVDSIIVLDTLPVEPASVVLNPNLTFHLSDHHNRLLLDSIPNLDSIQVCYRTISHQIFKPVYHRDYRTYQRTLASQRFENRVLSEDKDNLLSFGSVNSFGAITRGISFGNNQNVFVNSSLNLQMDGDLTDKLKVSALITDQNIPYQPEGNTQQIRDFDNVLVRIFNQDFEMKAGDIVLQNPVNEGYFLKYYKNVQGLSTNYQYQLNDKWTGQSAFTGSLGKGQFASTVISPEEGVQGPYKLRGNNGERFIVILPNSEKVFLDGKRLQRGFDLDYVIDYNLGEITFSNSVIITQFSRIRVDYEYSNQYYARSNISVTQQFSSERNRFYLNFYREKDNENNPLTFELTEKDYAQMQSIGDIEGGAPISGVDSIPYREGAVLYAKKDTVLNGVTMSYYRYSTDPAKAIFRISFSKVLVGTGNYAFINCTANGPVYQWVGEGNGDYLPVQLVPIPNQKQMFVVGFLSKINSYENVSQELAISIQDQNLYSDLEDDDNTGFAWRGQLNSEGRSFEFLPDYKFKGNLSYEFDHHHFNFIDRFRAVDFDRDWGYDVFADTLNTRQDRILSMNVGLKKDEQNQFAAEIQNRNRSGVVDGNQLSFNANKTIGLFEIHSKNFFTDNQLPEIKSSWRKGQQSISLNGKMIRPSYQFVQEHQLYRDEVIDSVISTQMYYDAHNVSLESGDTLRTLFKVNYINRTDQLPIDGEMTDFTHAQEFRFNTRMSQMKNHQLDLVLNYRTVKNLLDPNNNSSNLLGDFQWFGSLANEHITTKVNITTASVRELLRAFVYVVVPTGAGTHTWRDENNDGIQDLNEFYEAINPDEKNYIRLYTPTDEYVNAFQTTHLYQLDARMPKRWSEGGRFANVASRVSLGAYVKQQVKSTNDYLIQRIKPFNLNLASPDIVSARNLQRVSLFYNKNAPGLSIDFTYTQQQRKTLLSQGFELREADEWRLGGKLNIIKNLTLRGTNKWISSENLSDYLMSRNFQLNQYHTEGELIWQPQNHFRLTSALKRRLKTSENEISTDDLVINELALEFTYLKSGKGNFNASFSWLVIDYSGETNSYQGYEMLEGLQPGSNQRWNMNWQQDLGRGLQLTLQYLGRNGDNMKVVHTGNVQVTAFF